MTFSSVHLIGVLNTGLFYTKYWKKSLGVTEACVCLMQESVHVSIYERFTFVGSVCEESK